MEDYESELEMGEQDRKNSKELRRVMKLSLTNEKLNRDGERISERTTTTERRW
jgi:hypothetical protein